MDTERVTMIYEFKDRGETKRVVEEKAGEGLVVSELCELFRDFMESAGYYDGCVEKYFRGED